MICFFFLVLSKIMICQMICFSIDAALKTSGIWCLGRRRRVQVKDVAPADSRLNDGLAIAGTGLVDTAAPTTAFIQGQLLFLRRSRGVRWAEGNSDGNGQHNQHASGGASDGGCTGRHDFHYFFITPVKGGPCYGTTFTS
jgi:hypothetical protein